jgi:thiamine biosynthesis protein ThiS
MGGEPYPSGMRFFVFMRITVNGETFTIAEGKTIADLLNELRIDPARVAVEINLTIIRKSDHAAFRLHEGDAVEIVNFVGGG